MAEHRKAPFPVKRDISPSATADGSAARIIAFYKGTSPGKKISSPQQLQHACTLRVRTVRALQFDAVQIDTVGQRS